MIKHVSFTSFHNESPAVPGYSHTAISVLHLPKALRSHGHLPSLRLGIWQPAICNKIVSGHKQFNVASAISNFKKILSKIIFPFGTVKTESENIWICWRWLYKKQQNKEHTQDAGLLNGLTFYSNTIFGNISGKNEVISLYYALKCHGAQDEFFFSLNFRLCTNWLSCSNYLPFSVKIITAAKWVQSNPDNSNLQGK